MHFIFLFSFNSCEILDTYSEKTENTVDPQWEESPKAHKTQNSKVQKTISAPKPKPLLIPRSKNRPVGESEMKSLCQKLDKKFYQYGWRKSGCQYYKWQFVRRSHLGNPIAWVHYGEPEEVKANTTIVLCGVHGDEITPVKFCYDLMKYLDKNQKLLLGNRIIVAPLVTPDSFLKKWPSRTNARGVDVNRNFPTNDWHAKAHKIWKRRYKSTKRKFPGKRPNSEQETIFQVNLIKRYKPQKIISVHAPLTILDYDGPGHHGEGEGHDLLLQMSKSAKGYQVKNYPYFPGSLGNWAGHMNKIATYTLELPSSDNRLHKKFWKLFEKAMTHAITHKL